MKPWNLFNRITNRGYKNCGADVDYCIQYDEKEKTLYLYLQESDEVTDWIVNFSFIPYTAIPDNKGQRVTFHGGYYGAWLTAESRILTDFICQIGNLEVECKPVNDIVVTGWSYGGAMSLIAAYKIYRFFDIKPTVITFGAPKIIKGEKSKQAFLESVKDVKQYANNNDIVTHVIPWKPWTHINRIDCGTEKTTVKRLMNPKKHHCLYGDNTIYKEE